MSFPLVLESISDPDYTRTKRFIVAPAFPQRRYQDGALHFNREFPRRWNIGFYSRVIFPRLLDFAMRRDDLSELRRALLADLRGEVLEIGFGTGLNLPHYPPGVKKLTTVDPNPGMSAPAKKRIAASPIPVETRLLDAERLPFPDGSFDAAVSTWTLCSITNPDQALHEVHRVLKPGGRFFFLEHGLSDEPKIQKWQHRFTPLSQVFADGCHLNREIHLLIGRHFKVVRLDRFYLAGAPRIAGYFYRGTAEKS